MMLRVWLPLDGSLFCEVRMDARVCGGLGFPVRIADISVAYHIAQGKQTCSGFTGESMPKPA